MCIFSLCRKGKLWNKWPISVKEALQKVRRSASHFIRRYHCQWSLQAFCLCLLLRLFGCFKAPTLLPCLQGLRLCPPAFIDEILHTLVFFHYLSEFVTAMVQFKLQELTEQISYSGPTLQVSFLKLDFAVGLMCTWNLFARVRYLIGTILEYRLGSAPRVVPRTRATCLVPWCPANNTSVCRNMTSNLFAFYVT